MSSSNLMKMTAFEHGMKDSSLEVHENRITNRIIDCIIFGKIRLVTYYTTAVMINSFFDYAIIAFNLECLFPFIPDHTFVNLGSPTRRIQSR